MKSQHQSSPVTLVALLLLVGYTSSATAGDVPAWVEEQLLTPWYAAFNAQDANALASLYTSDGRTGPASGRKEIISLVKTYWAESNMSCSGAFNGFQIIGNLAAGWGYDTCIVTPKSGGESMTERTRWITVYERQANGTWLISRETYEPGS